MRNFVVLCVLSIFSFEGLSQTLSRKDLVEPTAALVQIADSFVFTEGPACNKRGDVYFTDIFTSRIYKWTIDNQILTVRDPSGRANGLQFDEDDNLLACEGASRCVTSTSTDGKVTTLASHYNGKKLNSPNDLWIDPKGGIYFTDPRYADSKWIWVEKGDSFDKIDAPLFREEQDVRALYYISPDRKHLMRVAEGFQMPNGVVGTLDGKKLYVSDPEKKEVYVFDILNDGTLTNRKLFISEYSDGMTLDEKNNLYITNGGVKIFSPEGEMITIIELPVKSSNVCFGGKDHKKLFITARKSIFYLQMKVTGQ